MASQWTVVDGRRWHARVSLASVPAGPPPVVLVHGLGVSSRYMVPIARRLARHYRTYAPDLPGFGKSQEPPRPLDLPELADALVDWMRAMGLDQAVLLGGSLGCQILADIAVRHPERLRQAVLVGPTGDPTVGSLWRWFGRLLLDVPREPLPLIPLQTFDYLAAGPRRVLHTAREMVRDPFAAKLALVRQPALVVRGERDGIVPQRWAEEVVRRLPRGRLVVVPGAGHAVNYNAPAALVAAVRAFLADATPESQG